MVRDALSGDHTILLKVVTGTLDSQNLQDEILESGVRPPLDSDDGQNMVFRDDIARLTVLAPLRNTKTNRPSLVFPGQACCWT